MLRYMLKRFAQSILTVALVVLAVFMLLRLMPTSGYFSREDYVTMDEAARTAYLRTLGVLDDPFTQFGRFASALAGGDLGRSITVYPRTPITEILAEKIPYSLWFGVAGISVSMALGLLLGVMMARYKDGPTDWLGTAYVVVVRAVPSLIYLFLIQTAASRLLGLPMIFYADDVSSWILPAASMALPGLAWYAIWLRRFMVDEENKDYIKFAVAKGVPRGKVMTGHVLRNAIVPLVQYFPTQVLLTITGSLIIESIYSIPGMGGLLVYAIRQHDNTLVQALVLIYSALVVAGVFLGDVLMALVDPRIKLSSAPVEREAA